MAATMMFLGIDPGVSGGLALIAESGAPVEYHKMPTTERDLLELLRAQQCAIPGGKSTRAVIERVNAGAFAAQRRMGVVSAFTFGKGYGALLMGLTAAGIPFDQASPQVWQKVLGVIYPKGSTQTEKKNIGKRRAQQLFPGLTVTHAIADALLLAEYARRLERGTRGKEGEQEDGGGALFNREKGFERPYEEDEAIPPGAAGCQTRRAPEAHAAPGATPRARAGARHHPRPAVREPR